MSAALFDSSFIDLSEPSKGRRRAGAEEEMLS